MKIWQKKITAILFALLWASAASFAQNRVKVTIEIVDIKKESQRKSTFVQDSLHAVKYLSGQLYQLYYDGFLGAAIVKKGWQEKTLTAKIFKGEQYLLKELGPGNIDPQVLNAIAYRKKKSRDRYFKFSEIENLFEKILNYAENSGHPFAAVKLDSLQIDGREISAELNLWSGPEITFDSLVVEGFGGIKYSWLAGFLDIRPGHPYREKTVQNIEAKLKHLEFVILDAEPQVVFSEESAKIVLQLRERKINSIDGLLGVLPNASDHDKLLLTGNLDLHLHNLFSSAKQLHIDWQKVKARSQTFHFELQYPRLLKTPLDIHAGLDLLKEDTLFFNRNFGIKLSFHPRPDQNIFVNTDFESSRLTGSRGSGPEEILQYNNFDVNYYGLTWQLNRLDDAIVPAKGLYMSVEGLAGRKTIRPDQRDGDAAQNFDSHSTQYKLKAHVENFIPFSTNYVGRIRVTSGSIIGENLFVNDLFRLGGLNTLRGFNENFFFVSDYLLGNFELRVQGAEETYFFAFYDQAFIKNKVSGYTDYPLGAGLGMSLSTQTGIFNFIFAFGKSQSQNFSINSAKIHFGYTGRF